MNADGNSAWSTEIPVTTDKIDLFATVVLATSNTSTSITVTWNAVDYASGYKIECASDAGFTQNVETKEVASGVRTVDFTSLTTNEAYYVRVMVLGTGAYNNSGWSNTDSATTDPDSVVIDTIISNNTDRNVATVKGVKLDKTAANKPTQTVLTFTWTPDSAFNPDGVVLFEIYAPKPRGGKAPLVSALTVSLAAFDEQGYWTGTANGLPVSITNGNGTYTIRVSGLDAGTKYTVNMQALDGNKYSKVTKVTASTAKYIAPKKDKVIPGLGEVTFSWKASTGIPAGTDREYTVGIFVGNDFIVFGSGDGTFTVDGVTITVAGTTATVTGLASQKYTFGIQEQVDITGDIAKSAIAKIIASPLPYKAPKFNIPAPVANGSTKLELKNASMTNPKTENQTYGYEVGVYDKTTKQYVWGEASVLTDGYTSEDGMDWTITGVTKGMKIALREILHAADGTVIAMSVMQKITLK